MAPQVRFLAVSSPEEKLQQLYDAAAQAVALEQRVLIWAAGPDQVAYLEQALWAHPHRREDFLPHAAWPCSLSLHPIILSWQPLALPEPRQLIVAYPHEPTPPLCEWTLQFASVLEFADLSDNHLQAMSRLRFKAWKEHGVTPSYEKVTGETEG